MRDRFKLMLGFILLITPGLFAQEKSLEALMPSETALLIKCSGIDALLEESQSLDLMHLWNDPEVKEFFADALEAMGDEFSDVEDPPIPLRELWSLCRGEISLAWTGGLTMTAMGPLPSAAISLDMGEQKDAILAAYTDFVDRIAWAQNLPRMEEEYKGMAICSVGREGGLKVHTCAYENLFLISLNLQDLHSMLEIGLEGKPSLAANPVFVRARDRAAGEGVDVLTFIQIPTLLKSVQPIMPLDLHGILDRMGLSSLEAVCLATTIEGGGSRDSLYLHCPGEKTGLLQAFSPAPLSDAALNQTPPEALWFVGAAMDPKMMMQIIDHLLPMINPQYQGMYRGLLEGFKSQVGLDVEAELLATLGKEFTFCVSMPKMGGMMSMIPDMIMSVSIEDEEEFNAMQSKLVTALSGRAEIGESTYDERTLRHVKLPPEIPLSPTFVVREGRLLITSSTLAMKKHLKWLAKGEPGLGESEDFQQAMASVPEGASWKCFINLKRSIEIGYGVAGPFLPSALAQSDMPFDPAMMPMTETLTGYISNASCYLATDEEGMICSQQSPMGAGTYLALVTSIAEYLVRNDLMAGVLAEQSQVTSSPSRMAPQQHPELGEIYSTIRRGAYEEADGRLTAWLSRSSGDGLYMVWAFRNRADCRTKLKRYDEAVQDYERLAAMDEDSRGFAYCSIARIYTLKDEQENAIPYVTKAIAAGHRIFENDVDLEKLRGKPEYDLFIDMVMDTSQLMADSLYEEAEAVLTGWIFENPYHALAGWAHKNRGDCYYGLERFDEAVSDYEKAAEQDKIFGPPVYYNIACICSTHDEPERAIEFLKKAIDAGFDDFDLIDNDGDLDEIRADPRFKALRWRL